MDALTIAPTPTYARELIAGAIRDQASGRPETLRILEAGCGRKWNIDLEGVDYRLTGVDLDGEALRYRADVIGDLDDWVVGDLRTVDLPEATFDVVFSAFVLEHISGAEQVLDRLLTALKDDGLLILRVPDGSSVYAFLARFLPFRLHVWYKRISEHDKEAGKPGHPPYPVVYDPIVTREGLNRYAADHGLTLQAEVGTNPHLDHVGRMKPVLTWGQHTLAALSRGRLDGTHSNLTIVYRKSAGQPG
jgi:SAM-dependent methyltransferase